MRANQRPKRALTAAVLFIVTIAVFASESLAFMWPVMALVDTQAAVTWRRRTRVTRP